MGSGHVNPTAANSAFLPAYRVCYPHNSSQRTLSRQALCEWRESGVLQFGLLAAIQDATTEARTLPNIATLGRNMDPASVENVAGPAAGSAGGVSSGLFASCRLQHILQFLLVVPEVTTVTTNFDTCNLNSEMVAAANDTRACRWRAADAVGERRLHFFFSAGGFGHMPSFLMRGKMVVSVLKAISHLHNAKGSVLTDARTDATVAAHFAQHGAPDVCVLVKYGGTRKGKRSAAAAACKAAGARGTAA